MDTQIRSLPGFYEPFSALSHLVGALVFVVLALFLCPGTILSHAPVILLPAW